MPDIHELSLPLDDALGRADGERLQTLLREHYGGKGTPVLLRRSLDTRRRRVPAWLLRIALYGPGESLPQRWQPSERCVHGPRIVVVGAGPAGSFAALELLEAGFHPIIVDRGFPVQRRRRSLKSLTVDGQLEADSNYCFGEGGAGTFSDGKLYTRKKKDKAGIRLLLEALVAYGAPARILYDHRPHIGSNKLPKVLTALREDMEARGVEYRWQSRVVSLLTDKEAGVRGVVLADGESVEAEAVILATGHSARDIYQLCHRDGVAIEAKPFALGVRVEHPQALVDEAQYGARCIELGLPPAFYQLTTQTEQHGVYSFCMCPGGYIVPASTEPDGLVVNGMSLSRRDSPFANSGLVITVGLEDMARWAGGRAQAGPESDPLVGMALQRSVERAAYDQGGGGFTAPALRVTDLVAGQLSQTLPASSYRLGLVPKPFDSIFPTALLSSLRQAMKPFDQRLKGFLSNEAVVVATESRSSAPVRILRDPTSLESPSHPGLYPCGEGAGFAGGIVSAALDGQRVAQAITATLRA